MNRQTIKVGRRTFTVLFPDLLRELNKGERAALRGSIKGCGVQVPVVVDENDGVVDGINRLTIASELGIHNVPTQRTDRAGMTLEEKRELALQLNDARRHLKIGERKVLKEQHEEFKRHMVELRGQGKTLEAIAEETGASVKTVQRAVRDQLCQADKVDSPAPPPVPVKIEGKDGKKRPATYKPREPKPAPAAPPTPPPAPPAVEDDEPADTEADDADDAPIPGGLADLVAAWRAATWQARREFDAMRERGELD
jgi:uncharacterized protein YerC